MRNLHELPLEQLDQAQIALGELVKELAPDDQALALLLADLMDAVGKECYVRAVGQETASYMFCELHPDT